MDSGLAGGSIEVASIVLPSGEVVVSMRPLCVFAKGPGSEIEQLRASLRGRWRQAARAVMVQLSLQGLSAVQIAVLLARPGPWALPRIWRYLGRPRLSMRTLYRRMAQVAIWRRPKLTARGDPDHDHVVAGIVARLIELPRKAVVLAKDETHLNLLPHVRASWTPRGARPQVPTPGKNRQVTVLGAIEVTTGRWVYRLGRRRAADFIALLRMLTDAFPRALAIVVICDNDSIHHARAVTRYLDTHPRLELLYGARYSPHDNPVERVWAELKNYVANTAVTWPGRLRQIHSFFRNRSPSQMLDTAAPRTSPWLPAGYEQNFLECRLAEQRTLDEAGDDGGPGLLSAARVHRDPPGPPGRLPPVFSEPMSAPSCCTAHPPEPRSLPAGTAWARPNDMAAARIPYPGAAARGRAGF